MFKASMWVRSKENGRRGWIFKVTTKGWLVVILTGDEAATWFRSDEVAPVEPRWYEAEAV